jgi:hypothetical protein
MKLKYKIVNIYTKYDLKIVLFKDLFITIDMSKLDIVKLIEKKPNYKIK